MNDLQTFIAKLIDNQHLTEAEAEAAMRIIMTGEATPAQIGGYLVALRMKGETAAEITGSARAIRAHTAKLTVTFEGAVLDTAGTGGDGAHTFNILHRGRVHHRGRGAEGRQARQPRRHLSAAAPMCLPPWGSAWT